MWFTKLIKQFFFWIDKIVYNFISSIYDLMITIARTSPLTQADISEMAERIYMLLAVFMIFKVTLSLITYVVNPDDFSDKSKGVSKLGTNIVISLALLVLTPYIFNYAYQLQTIILEDNSLATLIFGESKTVEGETGKTKASFFNTAGDDIAFMTMSAFLSPNLSLRKDHIDLSVCVNLFEPDQDGNKKFNEDCKNELTEVLNNTRETPIRENYIAAMEHGNLGLLLRQDLVLETEADTESGEVFVMDYRFIFSTVVGVVVVLLLLTFCMDVALRSIKLSFLQLIAPIPILSYIDPKSGKNGMFKKWYEMCFKTYLSLFIRLLALYFAIFIISKVSDMKMVDLVDGSYQTNTLVGILIIIGALMFAKQLPKMLEGLGIKLDGDGKFFLNPLKKFEEQAFAGKNITGAARGAVTGLAGAFSGAGWSRGITGAWRGMTSGKGWKETGKAEAEMNRKMRQAKLDGSTFGGRLGARFSGALGLPSSSESIEGRVHGIDEKIKGYDNAMAPSKKLAEEKKLFTQAVANMEDRAIKKIEAGEAGVLSEEYRRREARIESLKARLDQAARTGADTSVLEGDLANEKIGMQNFLNDTAMKMYIDANRKPTEVVGTINGRDITAAEVFGLDSEGNAKNDAALATMTSKMKQIVETYGKNPEHSYMKDGDASQLHGNLGRTKEEITNIENANEKTEKLKRDLEETKKQLYEEQRKAKANENAIK